MREAVVAVAPGEPDVPAPDTRVERLTLRKLLLVVGGSVAAYLVLSQLSNVDLGTLFQEAQLGGSRSSLPARC